MQVGSLREIICLYQLLLCDVEQLVLIDGGSRSLSFELENHNPIVVPSCEQIDLRVGCNDPESIILPLE